MVVLTIKALRWLGIASCIGGLYLIFGEQRYLFGISAFVLGSIIGAWAHGTITRAMSRPVTQEEAERWLRGER